MDESVSRAFPGSAARRGGASHPWRVRWRRAAAVLLGAAALLAAPSARAADPNVFIQVAPLPATVTHSRPADTPPFTTWSAIEVLVRDDGTNTLNNVRVEVTATTVGSASPVPFVTAINGTCSADTASPPKITCPIGQLRSGGSSSFIVVFRAPPDGTQIRYDWAVFYAEGSNDAGAHVDTNQGSVFATLGTPIATEVRSYVPPSGGTVYTGTTGHATAADPWSTTISVPTWALTTLLENDPATSPCALLSPDLLDCRQVEVSVPDRTFTTAAPLRIYLERAASTIRKGAKIANSVVYYDDGATLTPIPLCSLYPGSPSPTTVPRCIREQFEYTKRTAPTLEQVGNWRWAIDALFNGSYRN